MPNIVNVDALKFTGIISADSPVEISAPTQRTERSFRFYVETTGAQTRIVAVDMVNDVTLSGDTVALATLLRDIADAMVGKEPSDIDPIRVSCPNCRIHFVMTRKDA